MPGIRKRSIIQPIKKKPQSEKINGAAYGTAIIKTMGSKKAENPENVAYCRRV
jgi:hypothetical protein